MAAVQWNGSLQSHSTHGKHTHTYAHTLKEYKKQKICKDFVGGKVLMQKSKKQIVLLLVAFGTVFEKKNLS